MKNRSIKAKKTIQRSFSLEKLVTRHRILATLLSLLVLMLSFVGIGKYNDYLNKFSESDYISIEDAAEKVMRSVGAKDVEKYEACRYRSPDVYSSRRLYCSVELAAYIPYVSDQNAISVAKKLEKQINELGSTISHMSDFYQDPSNMLTGASVKLSRPLPNQQCTFTIASNEKAIGLAKFLPEDNNNNLIGIKFNCSAESRKEYFPVTYRQGQ